MKIKFKYANKEFNLIPYTTEQEKDILLYTSLNEDYTFDNILEALQNNIEGDVTNLTDNEKIVLLFSLRSISIGEEIELKFKCNSCKTPNIQVINVSDLIQDNVITKDYIHNAFEELTEDNLHKFVDLALDDLELDDYEEVYEEVKKSVVAFNLTHKKYCHKCRTEHLFNIKNKKYVVENLSEDSLMSLFQTTADLVFFGKYTKEAVDKMIPFERSIYIGILNKTREDLNK